LLNIFNKNKIKQFILFIDKMLISKDGNIAVTNDGAIIVENMNIEHSIQNY